MRIASKLRGRAFRGPFGGLSGRLRETRGYHQSIDEVSESQLNDDKRGCGGKKHASPAACERKEPAQVDRTSRWCFHPRNH